MKQQEKCHPSVTLSPMKIVMFLYAVTCDPDLGAAPKTVDKISCKESFTLLFNGFGYGELHGNNMHVQ